MNANALGSFTNETIANKKIRVDGVKITVQKIEHNATTNGDSAIYSADIEDGVAYVRPSKIISIA